MPYFDQATGMPKLVNVPELAAHFERYPRTRAKEEAFGRTLILIAIYTAATGKDHVPGYTGSISEPYLKSLTRGTDPNNPDHWGPFEKYEVFGTNIALAVLVNPHLFWDPLTEVQKRNVLVFLDALSKRVAYDCNHWYFHLVAVPVLDKYGMEVDRHRFDLIFKRLLGWYRGDGWFIDGANKGFDYYNLWGFQLYNNFLCHYDNKWHAEFGERVRKTTREFQKSFRYLYGRDGGPVPFGRSLSYRFASISALGYALLNDTNTLPPGEARRIASGCLKYFWEHGALSRNGLLELGYYGPNATVSEDYMARCSPYWAVQGLSALLLPEDHPFWRAIEAPMPADGPGGRLALPGAQMVLRVSPVDGEARAYKIGSPFGHEGHWQRGIKYFQHAYSSYLGFAALGEGGRDLLAGRTGVSYDGDQWCYRTNPRPIRVDPYHSISTYEIRLKRVNPDRNDFGEVTTHTLIGDDGEVHVFWHNSTRPAYLAIGGYSFSIPFGESLSRRQSRNSLLIGGGGNRSIVKVLAGPAGSFGAELLEPRKGWNASHIFGGRGAFPCWKSNQPVPPNTPVVVYVNGTHGRELLVPEIKVSRCDGSVKITFAGTRYTVPVPD